MSGFMPGIQLPKALEEERGKGRESGMKGGKRGGYGGRGGMEEEGSRKKKGVGRRGWDREEEGSREEEGVIGRKGGTA